MITWDTTSVGSSSFIKAIFILETLSHEQSIPVLEHLQQLGKATFAELLCATQMDALQLQLQLEQLFATGALCFAANGVYQLHPQRVAQVAEVAEEINLLRMQALQNVVT